jgi:hypothetical protein
MMVRRFPRRCPLPHRPRDPPSVRSGARLCRHVGLAVSSWPPQGDGDRGQVRREPGRRAPRPQGDAPCRRDWFALPWRVAGRRPSVGSVAADELSLRDPHTVPTRYWHRLIDGRIQCDICPRACKLHEGQRGLCFVRGRVADQVVLASYGRSSGFCVDPIEKKPLNLCRSETRSCWSGCVSVFVDDAAEHSGS